MWARRIVLVGIEKNAADALEMERNVQVAPQPGQQKSASMSADTCGEGMEGQSSNNTSTMGVTPMNSDV